MRIYDEPVAVIQCETPRFAWLYSVLDAVAQITLRAAMIAGYAVSAYFFLKALR